MLDFIKSPALRKLEETDHICNEIGEKDIIVLGAIAKHGIKLGINKNIEYRFSALKLVSSILKRVFKSKLEDCNIALLSAANSMNVQSSTTIGYAKEYITFLNIHDMNHCLRVYTNQSSLQ